MYRFEIIDDFNLARIERIASTIIRDIDNGVLKEYDQLPSINNFNKQFKLVRNTVEKAYGVLKNKSISNQLQEKVILY